MALSDPLGDMLTRIRNGQRAQLGPCAARPRSSARNVLEVLCREGYIRAYELTEQAPGKVGALDRAQVPQWRAGDPRAAARLQAGAAHLCRREDLPTVYNGLGIAILSTPRGVMSDTEAREAKVGGEILCTVF